MYWKSITIFLCTCFIVLLSLEAIAEEKTSSLVVAEVQLNLEVRTTNSKSLENAEAEQQVCEKETKGTDSIAKAAIKPEILKKPIADSPNLSFNFIYYILYKFKYIDSFGLSAPEKSTPKKDNILWH